MGGTDRVNHSFFAEIAKRSPELVDNLEGAEHLARRFVSQYLPVLLRAKTEEDRNHVWLAFWSYLIAPRNRRKPFGLSQEAAEGVLAHFQGVLSAPT